MTGCTLSPSWRNLQRVRIFSTGRWSPEQYLRPCVRLVLEKLTLGMILLAGGGGWDEPGVQCYGPACGGHRAQCESWADGAGGGPSIVCFIFHLITMSGSPHSYVLPRTPQQRRRHGKRQMGRMLSNSVLTIQWCRFLCTYCPWLSGFSRTPIIRLYLFLVILNCRRCNMTLNKVRKTSQAALLVLLEQGLADTRDVEEQVNRVVRE